MLSSIHPLGERARHNRFAVTASAHIVGAGIGGGVMGVVAATAGWTITRGEAVSVWVVSAIIAGAVTADLIGFTVPGSRRQVNEQWLDTFRGSVYGAGYGLQLGSGVLTIIPTWLVPATIATAALTGSWFSGGLIGAVFGVTRGIMVLTVYRVDNVAELQRFHRRLHDVRSSIRIASLLSVALVGIAAGVLS